jgi:hypothetical protein
MTALSPATFRDVFIAWSRALCESTAGSLVAIDGKTVRGAFRSKTGDGALHLVNARGAKTRWCSGSTPRT